MAITSTAEANSLLIRCKIRAAADVLQKKVLAPSISSFDPRFFAERPRMLGAWALLGRQADFFTPSHHCCSAGALTTIGSQA